MPRVTYVQRAQVRYPTVPTVDGNGQQVVVPVNGKDGRPKLTRAGKEITRRLTHEDRTAPPLPNHACGKCGKEIMPGEPYKWIAPRSGPYGGRTLYRCGACPNWQLWEYSQSMNARLAEISYDFAGMITSVEFPDDVQNALDDVAGRVRDLAEEKRESASNIEEGFQHATSQSDELNDAAEQLDSWADEIESATIPELPEEYEDGWEGDDAENQLEAWRDEVSDACSIVDEPPV